MRVLLILCLASQSALAFPGWTSCKDLPNDFHPTWNCPGREALWNLWRNPFFVNLIPKTDRIAGQPDFRPGGGFLFLVHKSGLPYESYRPRARGVFPFFEEYFGFKPPGSFGGAFRPAYAGGY